MATIVLKSNIQREILQLTIAMTRTACTVLIMVCKYPGNLHTLHFPDLLCASANMHAILQRCCTSRYDLRVIAVPV